MCVGLAVCAGGSAPGSVPSGSPNPLPQGEGEKVATGMLPLPFAGGAGEGAALILAALFTLQTPRAAAADANALWQIVGERCVPDEKSSTTSPKPCEQVDLAGGYAVLKDIVGETQFLVIPTTRVGGIESPEILALDAPNYWEAAWQARSYVEDRAGITLCRVMRSGWRSIRSARAHRTSCISMSTVCGSTSSRLCASTHPPSARSGPNSRYRSPATTTWPCASITGASAASDPFDLLADGIPGARADMAHYTLVVAGAPDGFVLLAGHASPATGNWGSGEQLQDHACAAATAASR